MTCLEIIEWQELSTASRWQFNNDNDEDERKEAEEVVMQIEQTNSDNNRETSGRKNQFSVSPPCTQCLACENP